jgi:hypothetical protein
VLLGFVRDRVGGGKFLIFISILWAARQIKPHCRHRPPHSLANIH